MELIFRTKTTAVRSLIDVGFSRKQTMSIMKYPTVRNVSNAYNHALKRNIESENISNEIVEKLEAKYGKRRFNGKKSYEIAVEI